MFFLSVSSLGCMCMIHILNINNRISVSPFPLTFNIYLPLVIEISYSVISYVNFLIQLWVMYIVGKSAYAFLQFHWCNCWTGKGQGQHPALYLLHSDKGPLIDTTFGLQLLNQHDPHSCSVIQLTCHFVHRGVIREFVRCIAETELLYLQQFLCFIKTIIIVAL